MRRTRHLLPAVLALALLAGAPAAVAGKPVGIAESFPTKCWVDDVAVAPAGGVWFACSKYAAERHGHVSVRADVGRVSADGKVTEFAGAFPKESQSGGPPGVVAADGSFWFPVVGNGERSGKKPPVAPSLARVTPGGEVATFPVTGGYVVEMAAQPEGNVLFVTAGGYLGKERATWQVSPAGAIAKPAVEPPLPLEQPAFPQKPVTPPSALLGGSVIGADGNLWYGLQSGVQSAIGRVTPTGQVTEFHDCLAYGQPYFGPETLVRGAEGNIWFTSLAERSTPNIVDPPSIGMVTPAGAITQIYAGVVVEPKTIAAGSEGGVWFAGGLEEVQRIKPPQGVVNTVHIGKVDGVRRNGSARLTVKVPSGGRLQAKPTAIVIGQHPKTAKRIAIHAPTTTAKASVCGSPQIRVKLAGEARRRLQGSGKVRVAVAVTFIPQGGIPYTEEKILSFRVPRR
ncbi:MAG TPA: hypothetical protein VJL81_01780 [Solirubrobacterales bacterium]|nr:hypothetical protein [Solirubrobacterales bacterium]